MHKMFWSEKLTERGQLEDISIHETIILKWILVKLDGYVLIWVHLAHIHTVLTSS